MSIITDYFPKERRGLALSFFYMSSPIGMALTFSIGSVIAAAYGWHVAFFVAGGPGIILACLIFFTVREPIRGRYDAHVPAVGKERSSFREEEGQPISIRPLHYLPIHADFCFVTPP